MITSQPLHHFEVLGEDVLLGKSDGELCQIECLIGHFAQLVAIASGHGMLNPPGTAAWGWIALPARISSISAHMWRTFTTFLAMSGAACSTPMTLRME